LNEASKLISDALIEMEVLMSVAPKAYLNYFLIAIILIVILAIVLFIILYRKMKKKRPKLLRELESESQAAE